jgi:hypothetical protein
MSSVREGIIAQIVTLLSAGTPPATVSRTNTFSRDDADGSLPAIVVYPLAEKVTRTGDTVAERVMSIAVDCQAKDAPPIDQKLDPILNWVVQKICADDTIGGRAWRAAETGTEWAIEVADEDVGAARVTFDIFYATDRSDPTVQRNG